jgi:hypothetical protein
VRLSKETLQTIVEEIEKFDIDSKIAEAIVLAVVEWYDEVRRLRMKMNMQGRKAGRPRKMTAEQVREAGRLRECGMSFDKIGAVLGVKGRTVWYELLPIDRRQKIMKRVRKTVDRWQKAKRGLL